MNSLKVARAALRARPSAIRTVKRGYADVAPDKLRLSLALPHQVRLYGEGDRLRAEEMQGAEYADRCGCVIVHL